MASGPGRCPARPILWIGAVDCEDTAMTEKQHVLEALASLPEDATIEDAMDRLYLLYKVRRGIEQADSGAVTAHEVVKQRLSRWLQ
jgi:hypothetical protein